FTGRPFDTHTGLQNNLNRWYDPAVGRWLSADPIGFAGGDGNLYRYVGNRASYGIDPNGLYLIVWGEWAGYEWPDGFRSMVMQSLDRIAFRLPLVIKEIDLEMSSLSQCMRCELGRELQALRNVLARVLNGIRSKKDVLRFFRYDLSSSHPDSDAIQGPTFPIFSIIGFPRPYIAFNQGIRPTWFERDVDWQDRILFHELTHMYGTVDDDSKGELMNAHTIMWLVVPGHSLRGNPVYNWMKTRAARKCGSLSSP
ncbi:MAG: RHS repeat-associated core domain-containing protein, partial [Synergistales bacterium]|nr:RHS repeat-associated core domain-containing protein [Synergistales bacterium]